MGCSSCSAEAPSGASFSQIPLFVLHTFPRHRHPFLQAHEQARDVEGLQILTERTCAFSDALFPTSRRVAIGDNLRKDPATLVNLADNRLSGDDKRGADADDSRRSSSCSAPGRWRRRRPDRRFCPALECELQPRFFPVDSKRLRSNRLNNEAWVTTVRLRAVTNRSHLRGG